MIRNGYVSNSSSSSFIVRDSCAQTAEAMLDIVQEDWMETIYAPRGQAAKIMKARKAMFKRIRANLSRFRLDFDGSIHGIVLPSTNYYTYILSTDDSDESCWVDTCNNHNWADLCPDYLDETAAGMLYTLTQRSWFYDLRTGGIVGKERCDCEYYRCQECNEKQYSYRYSPGNVPVCPSCGEIIRAPSLIRRRT